MASDQCQNSNFVRKGHVNVANPLISPPPVGFLGLSLAEAGCFSRTAHGLGQLLIVAPY